MVPEEVQKIFKSAILEKLFEVISMKKDEFIYIDKYLNTAVLKNLEQQIFFL